jgi:hypothetical protein
MSSDTPAERLLQSLNRVIPSHSFALRITAERLRLDHLHNIAKEYRLFTDWLFCFLRLSATMRNLCRSARGIRDTYIDYDPFDPERYAVFDEVPQHDPFPVLLLRTYAKDVELIQPWNSSDLSTRLISPLLSQSNPFLRRFNMVLHIPELNVVLIGSQCGDVVIVTLTQLLDPSGLRDPRSGKRRYYLYLVIWRSSNLP